MAVQGSATPSERAFSSGALTDTKRRNRLAPAMFEALQLLKSAYHNGHIKAANEADCISQDFAESCDELEYEEMGM